MNGKTKTYIIAMVDERAREGEEERQGGRPVVEAEGGRSGEGSERQSTAGRHHGKVVLRRARTPLLPPPSNNCVARYPIPNGHRELEAPTLHL